MESVGRSPNAPERGSRGFVRAAVDDVSRFAHITRVLMRHGLGHLATRTGLADGDAVEAGDTIDLGETAHRIRLAFEELGPTFVKAGQMLSTRPDILPPEVIRELARLQDDAPPVEFDHVRAAIEHALGQSIDRAFARFEETPLAAASMAQTHVATLRDGTEVVVKVQRPGIAETIRADLDLFRMLARLLEATVQDMDVYAPGDVVRALDEALSAELDFEAEASNLQQFAGYFEGQLKVSIPRVFPELSRRTVLTMTRLRGQRIDKLVRDSPEAHDAARWIIDAFYQQIFRVGHFHGDPHPGNLLVLDDGAIGWIDFGLCGRLSRTQRELIVLLLISTLSGDIDGLARSLLRMGRPMGHVNTLALKEEIACIRERHLHRSLDQIDLGRFIEECVEAAQRYRIRVAPEYAILAKATVTLEGVIRGLAPGLDLVSFLEPYSRRLVAEHYSADRLIKGAVTGAVQMGHFLSAVPDQLNQVLMDLGSGHLKMRVESEAITQLSRELNRQTTRVFMAMGSAACTIATPLWYAHEPLWVLGGRIPLLTTVTALTAISLAFWGVVWHVGGGRRQDWRLRMRTLMRVFGR